MRRALLAAGGAVALAGAMIGMSAVASAQTLADDTLFVAPGGDDAATGTIDAPLATIQKAIDLVAEGGSIAVRGGTYALSTNIQIKKSGTAEAPLSLSAYGNEHVVIDAEELPYTPGAVGT